MITPPLLLGGALLFWGWQTGLWILAAVLALVMEASRLIRMRWDLADADFRRISDGCTILFVLLLIYILMSERSATFIVVIIRWLPVVPVAASPMEVAMSSLKTPWPYLPQAIRAQALACWGSGARVASPGLGDGYLYHWVREAPSAGYCGPLPTGRLVRRTKEP